MIIVWFNTLSPGQGMVVVLGAGLQVATLVFGLELIIGKILQPKLANTTTDLITLWA